MDTTTLSPLAQLMLGRLSNATGLTQIGILEILILDAYVDADLGPVGLHSNEPSDDAPQGRQGADEDSDDPAPAPDPVTARKAILTAAEGMSRPFRSIDLVDALKEDGIHVTPRNVGQTHGAEDWPTSDQTLGGVRVWLPR